MALDSYEYLDPMEVAIRRESKTCKGCAWLIQVQCFGDAFERCKINPQRAELRRCRKYHALPSAR